jgi:23S rRNA (guanosine2251-2'-O)-methyltransferase
VDLPVGTVPLRPVDCHSICVMVLSKLMKDKTKEIIIVLDNIRSVENVGAIFRTADAIGVNKIYLCGITPTPIDRFGRERNDLHKSALGSEKVIPWEYAPATLECVSSLKKEGYTVVSVEQAQNSIDYKEVTPAQKTVCVFGNEVDGVSKDVLNISDIVAEISMSGIKESLNVSVTCGIILFRFFDTK